MNQEWINFLAQHGASADRLNFGNPTDELNNAQNASIMTPLTDLGLIRASGKDAVDFLHNLLTNDVENLAADGANRFGFCTPKGRLLASFLVWHDGADLILALSADIHPAILKKLSMYVLRSQVKLIDASDEFVLFGLSGSKAETALAELAPLPGVTMQATAIDHGHKGQLIRLAEQRYLLVLKAAEATAIWQKLSAHVPTAGLDAWHWLEIASGIPQITAPTQEEFVPQMVNYELIGGVSFKKGCYPGQEIVARSQYLGKIKRRMYRAHLVTGLPVAGSHIFAPETGDQACGMVVNAAPSPQGGQEVLAVIQTSCADIGRLHLDSRDGPLLTLYALPYQVYC